jgi:hypothetical protein
LPGLSSEEINPGSQGLTSEPIGGPQTIVPLAGDPNKDTFFVRSPLTGDIRAVPQSEAADLVLRAGWEPVVQPAAERLLSNQLLRERASPFTALGAGAFSGLTGGLGEFVLPHGGTPGARAISAAREEYPWTELLGAAGGTIAPFAGPLKGLKLLSVPGAAQALGAGVERAAGEGIAAKALGFGLEGGVQGATYEAGQTAIDDTPLTAQKIAAGFLMGATPGVILGLGAGGTESLFNKYVLRGKLARDNILRPGLDDLDLMQIAQREHGVAVPGISEEILAGIANSPEVTPEIAKMAKDSGPVGQQIRNEMLNAVQLREGANIRAAQALNQIRDLDEVAINGVAGRMKREQIQKWIPAGEEHDPGIAIMEAWRDDTPEEVGVRQRQMDVTNPAAGGNRPKVETPEVNENTVNSDQFVGFANEHPQNKEMLQFLNEERRAVSKYEREGTAGIGLLGIDGTRAGDIRRIANTEHGAQKFLNDAVESNVASKGVFYRGERINRDFFENEIQPLLGHKNKHLENPNIWSTAENPEGAISFAKKKLKPDQVPVLYEIHTGAGVPADKIPGSNSFEEYLMPRGRKLWVMDIGEEDGIYKIRLLDSETPPANITPRSNKIELQPGRIVEPELPPTARSERIAKLGRAIEVWAHDNNAVDSELRSALGAGFGRKALKDAIRRGLINREDAVMEAVQSAYSKANQASREQLDNMIGKHVASPETSPWRKQALQLIDGLGQEADNLASRAKGVIGKKPGGAAQIRDLVANARNNILNGDKANAFAELDYLKKRIGKFALPGEYLSTDENVAAMARRQYEELRQNLETAHLWGDKAANAQRDINRIFNNRINRSDVFFNSFYVDSGRAHPNNPWVRLREATPESVGNKLDGIIDPRNSRDFQAFKQHIQESRDVLANLKSHYALSEQEAGKLSQWGKAIDEADKAFDLASYYSRREAQAKALMANHGGPIPSWAKWVAMHFLGPAGFVGTAALERAMNPGRGLYMRAVLERTMRNSEGRIANAVECLLTGRSTKTTGIGLTQSAARGTVSLFGSDPDKRHASYVETIKHLSEIADPRTATDTIRKTVPFAIATLPGVEQNLTTTLSSAAKFILNNAPSQPRWTPEGIKVDKVNNQQLNRFENIVQGTLDPISLFEKASRGEPIHPQALEGAEISAPELVDNIRMLTISEITNGKHKIPKQNNLNLSILLGIDLDQSLESGYINAQQMAYAGRAASAPTASDDRRTGNDDGVNKQYRNLTMTKDQEIQLGEPPQ